MSQNPPQTYLVDLFKSLGRNQISPASTAWLARVLYALDSKDLMAYISYMSSTVTITFNNGNDLQPSMNGIDAVREGLGRFWQSFASVKHEELNIYGTDENFAHEALNHYETLDGRKISIRAVAYIDRNGEGKIEALRIYNDQNPLWN